MKVSSVKTDVLAIALYSRIDGTEFLETDAVRMNAPLTRDGFVATLTTPKWRAPIAALRVDFAERPCRFRLGEFVLKTGAGETIFEWREGGDFLNAGAQLRAIQSGPHLLVECTGHDPHIVIAVPPKLVVHEAYLVLRVLNADELIEVHEIWTGQSHLADRIADLSVGIRRLERDMSEELINRDEAQQTLLQIRNTELQLTDFKRVIFSQISTALKSFLTEAEDVLIDAIKSEGAAFTERHLGYLNTFAAQIDSISSAIRYASSNSEKVNAEIVGAVDKMAEHVTAQIAELDQASVRGFKEVRELRESDRELCELSIRFAHLENDLRRIKFALAMEEQSTDAVVLRIEEMRSNMARLLNELTQINNGFWRKLRSRAKATVLRNN